MALDEENYTQVVGEMKPSGRDSTEFMGKPNQTVVSKHTHKLERQMTITGTLSFRMVAQGLIAQQAGRVSDIKSKETEL